jgi:hypothetical protein
VRILDTYRMEKKNKIITYPHIILFLSFILSWATSLAQYENDWIDFSKQYLKIRLADEGVYQITPADLDQAGFSSNTIDPRSFRMIYRGEEQKIFVQGQSDGSFDANDKILFYGTPNDGTLDTELYLNPNDQPHQFSSLYTDSSAYFLTWNGNPGNRVSDFFDANYSGLSPDPFFEYTETQTYENQWFDGFEFANKAFYSEYTEGEGWMSSNIMNGNQIPFNMKAKHLVSGEEGRLIAAVYSQANPQGPNDKDAANNNHEVRLFAGISLDEVYVKRHSGLNRLDIDVRFTPAQMNEPMFLRYASTFGAKARHALSFQQLIYKRAFVHDGNLLFEYNSSNPYIEFSNYTGSSEVFLWDIENGKRIKGSVNGSTVRFKLENAGGKRLFYLYDESRVESPHSERTAFTDYSGMLDADYIIVTNKKLRNGAQEYADYRSSNAGGSHKVLMVYTDELYNQFSHGIHHPLAIRRFCDYFLNNTPNTTSDKHLLLLGKGQLYFKYTYFQKAKNTADLVPTWGSPPSDYLFTSGLQGTRTQPALATGRVPANSDEQVRDYLNKLKEYEAAQELGEDWQKKVLQLAGGRSFIENRNLVNYLRSYQTVFKNDSFGGYSVVISKEDAVSIDESHIDRIKAEVNEGASMVYYFGHGASEALDLSMGSSDIYSNKGKYPVYYFNGCILGNTFENNSLCEDFLLEPDAGAIAWIAGSSYGFEGDLHSYGTKFHRVNFREFYGKSIGTVLKETMRQHQVNANQYGLNQNRQMLLHGDPAIKMFSPKFPDYTFDGPVKLTVENVSTNLDSLPFRLTMNNLGKVTRDTVVISLKRSNAAQSLSSYYTYKIVASGFSNTLDFKLPNDQNYAGINYLEFTLDSANNILEQGTKGESNNQMTNEVFIPSDNIHILAPCENEIVTDTRVDLVVQADDLQEGEITVTFQLDTTPFFNSPNLKIQRVKSKYIQTATFNLLPKDSVDYFWRAQLEGSDLWKYGKFALIYKDTIGWSAGHRLNLTNGRTNFINIDSSSGKFSFGRVASKPFDFQTWGQQSLPWRNIRINGYGSFLGNLNSPGINIIAINPDNETRLVYPSAFNIINNTPPSNWGYFDLEDDPYYQVGGYTGVFNFNTTIPLHRDSLVQHLHNIPDGYWIFMHNGTNTGIEQWEDTIFTMLELYGVGGMKGLVKNGDPFCIVGRKGFQVGQADEIYADYSDTLFPPPTQALFFNKTILVLGTKGTYTSEEIGPATSWSDYHIDLDGKDHPSDSFNIELLAIDRDGVETSLQTGMDVRGSLASLDAKRYPFIRFKISFVDEANRTPMRLDRIVVHYQGIAEATIDPTAGLGLNKDTIWRGENLIYNINFKNIGRIDIDSTDVTASSVDLQTGNEVYTKNLTLKSFTTGETVLFKDTLETGDLHGDYRLNVFLNKANNPEEKTLINNSFNFQYHVKSDLTTPVMNVSFDGIEILDNDIVSAKPEIAVSVLENDSLFFFTDISYFDIQLKLQSTDSFEQVDLMSNMVRYEPNNVFGKYSKVLFNPDQLPDGTHTLYVRAQKPGYPDIFTDYTINFQVISRQTVTHVFPYPNPFTSQTRFVFTLTGVEEIPDYFSIQIMNIRGVVVKEIRLHETEALRIGNNISEYRWDGTDEYGDKLANGVYLYRTVVRYNNEVYEVRDEAQNSSFFENEIGKIYIMR